MQIGMVGLGKMGGNMTRRLLRDGHTVVGFDPNTDKRIRLEKDGMTPVSSLEDLAQRLAPARTVWVMVPAGNITETTLMDLSELLEPGDRIVDGGNSNYKHTLRRGDKLAEKGIDLVDVGTSGGVWGLEGGYSMMVGGAVEAVEALGPILETLAPGPDQGWGHVGPRGSGHFVKMVHNGVEYGMMQAIAEGFEILKAKKEFGLDLHQVAEIWRFGSVIRSWLLDLTANALAEDQELSEIRAWVDDSGEGRWTVFEAIDLDIAAPVITAALQRRLRSRAEAPFSDKLLAALRQQFGGHAVKEAEG